MGLHLFKYTWTRSALFTFALGCANSSNKMTTMPVGNFELKVQSSLSVSTTHQRKSPPLVRRHFGQGRGPPFSIATDWSKMLWQRQVSDKTVGTLWSPVAWPSRLSPPYSCGWTLASSRLMLCSISMALILNLFLPPADQVGWSKRRRGPWRSQSLPPLIQNAHFLLQCWWQYFWHRQFMFQQ